MLPHASRGRSVPSPESPAGGRVEQIAVHSEGRGENPQLLRLLHLQPQRLLRRCEWIWRSSVRRWLPLRPCEPLASRPSIARRCCVTLPPGRDPSFFSRPSDVLSQLAVAVMSDVFQHHAGIRGPGPAVCGWDRTLLQLHRGQWRDCCFYLLTNGGATTGLVVPPDLWRVAGPQVQEHQRSPSKSRSLPVAVW